MGKTWKANSERLEQTREEMLRGLERHHKAQAQVSHMREETHRDTPARQRKALRRIARGLALLACMVVAQNAMAWPSGHSGGTHSGGNHGHFGATGSSGGMSGYMHGKG